MNLKVEVKPLSVAPWNTKASWPSSWLVTVRRSVVALPMVVLPFRFIVASTAMAVLVVSTVNKLVPALFWIRKAVVLLVLFCKAVAPLAPTLNSGVPTPAALTSIIFAVWLLAPCIVAVTLPMALLCTLKLAVCMAVPFCM